MILRPSELPKEVEQELQMYDDYRNSIGHIVNPHDITTIVFMRLCKRGIITKHNGREISQRLHAEQENCTEEYLQRRMSDLKAKVMGIGANIDNGDMLVREARCAFHQWFKMQGLPLEKYESHSLYKEILQLGDQLSKKTTREKISTSGSIRAEVSSRECI